MNRRRWHSNRISWTWFALMFIAAGLHFASYDFRNQPILGDISYYLYYAARTAEGDVPYVDYFEIKTPLVIFAGMWLQQLGGAIGMEPLYVVRVGYLLMATASAAVLGVICLRLSNNRSAAGWIGLLAYCGFNVLGILPATGNCPKMISILCTWVAMLLVCHRKWFWAGLLAGIASLDWQVSGALTFIGVVVGGLACRHRGRNVLWVLLGTATAWVPSIIYFATKRALGTYLYMVTLGAFTKASSEEVTLWFRLRTIWETAGQHCEGEKWLLAVAMAGVLLFIIQLYRQRRSDTFPLWIALACYQFGLMVFSLVDFQARLDLFILLATLALFAGLALANGYCLLRRLILVYFGRGRRALRSVVGVAAAALLVVLIRPSFLAGDRRIDKNAQTQNQATLHDQREVADRFSEMLGEGRVAVVRWQELLFLGGGINDMPFVSWNLGTWSHYRRGDEGSLQTLSRLLEPENLDVIVLGWSWLPYLHKTALGPWLLSGYQPMYLESESSAYRVIFFRRKDLPPPTTRGIRYLDPEFFKTVLPESPAASGGGA